MTDFWRIANVLIIVAIIILVIWLQKRKKNKPHAVESSKFDELQNRKQKLACDLKAYEDDVTQLETASRQMMKDYFDQQEMYVNKLVKEEINVALDEMTAKVKADISHSFTETKNRLQKDFDK